MIPEKYNIHLLSNKWAEDLKTLPLIKRVGFMPEINTILKDNKKHYSVCRINHQDNNIGVRKIKYNAKN